MCRMIFEEQDKSSDIEQQPPFGDRKISNIQPQNRGRGTKSQEHHIILTKYEAEIQSPLKLDNSGMSAKGCGREKGRNMTQSYDNSPYTKRNIKKAKWQEKKEKDLTQSYDKSPNTHRKIQKATWQHKNATKIRLHNDCGPT